MYADANDLFRNMAMSLEQLVCHLPPGYFLSDECGVHQRVAQIINS
jgi:hypothetical protein